MNVGSVRWSSPMKAIFALALVTLPLIACKGSTPKEPPLTVVYDGWWSNDYAAQSVAMQCPPGNVKLCKDEARGAERDFSGEFSAAFQTDPSCSGIRLLMYDGPGRTSDKVLEMYAQVGNKPHWDLQVNFNPALKKQPWQLNMNPGATQYSSGEGDAPSVVHSVCSIAKRTGGSVIN
jgi:hypothetical protein